MKVRFGDLKLKNGKTMDEAVRFCCNTKGCSLCEYNEMIKCGFIFNSKEAKKIFISGKKRGNDRRKVYCFVEKIITVSKERMDGKVINVLFNEYNTENFVKAKKNADWLFNLICEFHQNRANEYNPWTRFRGASSLLYAAIKDERKRLYSQYVIDKQDCKKYAVLTLPVREFFQFLYDEKLITAEKRDEYINTLYSIIPGNNVGGNIVQHKDTADSPQDINKITDAFLYIINQLYKGSHIPQKAHDAKIFWCETRNKDKIICIDNMEDLISLAGKVEGLANYTIMLNELSAESQSSGDLLKDIFYRLIDRGIAHHNKNRIKYRYLKKEYYAIKADELEKLFNNNSVKM